MERNSVSIWNKIRLGLASLCIKREEKANNVEKHVFLCNCELIPWYHQKVILNNCNSLCFCGSLSQSISKLLTEPVNLPKPLRGFWVLFDLSFKKTKPCESLIFLLGSTRRKTFSHVSYVMSFLLLSNGPAWKPISQILQILIWNIYFRFSSSLWLEILFLHMSSSYFHIILPTGCILKTRVFKKVTLEVKNLNHYQTIHCRLRRKWLFIH